MKKLIMLGLIFGMAVSSFALQTPTENVQAPTSTQVEATAPVVAPAPNTKWYGVGKEIADAFKGASEGFISTVDKTADVTITRVNQFADTRVGKFTMVIIAFQYFGEKGFRWTIGCIGTIFLWWTAHYVYRIMVKPRKKVVKRTGLFQYEYTYDPPFMDTGDAVGGTTLVVALCTAILTFITWMCLL